MMEIRALAALDRWNEVDELLQQVEGMEPAFGSTPANVFGWLAGDFAKMGHEEESQDMAQRALDWCEAQDPDEYVRFRAWALLFLERPEQAMPLIEQVLDEDPENGAFRGWRGIALAQQGDVAGAEEEAAWLEPLDLPYQHGSKAIWRAGIYAHLGQPDKAVELVRQAIRDGYSWFALTRDLLLVPLWENEEFQRILHPTT
jgi:tetratricopeptide (TPR) repeat protein